MLRKPLRARRSGFRSPRSSGVRERESGRRIRRRDEDARSSVLSAVPSASDSLLEQTIGDAFVAYENDSEVESSDTDDCRWVVTGAGYEGFNAVLRAPCASAVDVEEALEPFRRRRVPMLWHLFGADAASAGEHLAEGGFEFYEEEPGMVAHLDAAPAPSTSPSGLRISPARSVDELRQFVGILTGSRDAAFLERVTQLRAATGLGIDATFQHLLGSLDGRLVATAAVAHGRNASEIQHVVTLPDARRRGVGTAMTAAAMTLVSRHGHDQAVLTSSTDGEGVYRSLGFDFVCTVRRFLWKPPESR
jgi:ribosomal protein S18 acetylase RimI-like enzyme